MESLYEHQVHAPIVPKRRIWPFVVAGVLVLFALGIITVLVFAVVFSIPPDGVTAEIIAPAAVSQNSEFDIRVIIRNTTDRDIDLEEIDVGKKFVNAFGLIESTPDYIDIDILNIFGGEVDYLYDEVISPGQDLEVVLRLKALETGIHSGKLNVCVETFMGCIEDGIRIEVTP